MQTVPAPALVRPHHVTLWLLPAFVVAMRFLEHRPGMLCVLGLLLCIISFTALRDRVTSLVCNMVTLWMLSSYAPHVSTHFGSQIVATITGDYGLYVEAIGVVFAVATLFAAHSNIGRGIFEQNTDASLTNRSFLAFGFLISNSLLCLCGYGLFHASLISTVMRLGCVAVLATQSTECPTVSVIPRSIASLWPLMCSTLPSLVILALAMQLQSQDRDPPKMHKK